MKLPPLQGNFNQQDFFIFVACDSQYFDDFAISLVNSTRQNTEAGVHLHLFNPRQDQITHFQNDHKVSITYEFVTTENFAKSTENLEKKSLDPAENFKISRSLNAAKKGNDVDLTERIMKTYFACARFVRLAEIVKKPQSFFAIDIDAIVRKRILRPEGNFDFFIHFVDGKDPRFLAGGIYFSDSLNNLNFLDEYKTALTREIENDQLFWSMDQEILKQIVPKYHHGPLPMSLIDWNMDQESAIWTAKGKRKDLDIFISEKMKYSV